MILRGIPGHKGAEAKRAAALDVYLENIENSAMGGVAIFRDGRLDYRHYLGYASVEDGIQNSADTEFPVASVTKMFTATMIFQLIEEGRLTLHTKLSRFYPGIPDSADITISQMLSQRSGIHDYLPDDEVQSHRSTGRSRRELVDLIVGFTPDFPPGTDYRYSNSNFLLLGYIIEDLTGFSYQQELERRITSELQLGNTRCGDAVESSGNEAIPYLFREGSWVPRSRTDSSLLGGAGAIVSTPQDLGRFAIALFHDELITHASLIQMEERLSSFSDGSGYGRGLMRFSIGGDTAYGHSGAIDGFISFLAFFPDEDLVVVVLSNGLDVDRGNIFSGLYELYKTSFKNRNRGGQSH